MKRSSASTYNLIALIFLALTVFTFLCVLGMLVRIIQPPGFLRSQVASAPTLLPTPSDTPTLTPSKTPTASDTPTETNTPTPLPPTATNTSLPSSTPLPSDTPLPTETPTKTPTDTKTPVPSKTPLPTRTPKGFVASQAAPQASPTSNAPFALAAGSPSAGPNPDATTGCKFQALAGQVRDLANQPLKTRIRISVAGPKGVGVQTTPSPLNDTLYSPGSWLFPVDNKVSTASFTVQLLNSTGAPLSDKVPVKFTGDCQKNIIYVNFVQMRPVDLP